MQVYSQMSTRTTFPRIISAVSGAEFTQRSALSVGNLASATRLEPTTMPTKRSRRITLMKGHSKIEAHGRSKGVRVDDCRRERLRGFLRQVVADTPRQVPVHVATRELRSIGRWGRMRCTIGVPFERDG